jgi:ergothioneine biosynthesis protein EgtB
MAMTIAPAAWANRLKQLENARERTDELFRVVASEAMFDRPIPERHRIIFYLGHLEAFDWNLIWKGALQREPFSEELDRLFAFGIDPVDGTLPADQPGDWPSIAEVTEYCRQVRTALDGCLQNERTRHAAQLYSEEFANGVLMHVALEHRLMHAETLAYMLHQLPYDRKRPRPQIPAPAPRAVVPPRMVSIPAGVTTLGQRRGQAFGWDNEFEEHRVEVPAFRIDARKITNGQFLEFLQAGGYDERRLWAPEDWAWKEEQGVRDPALWVRRGDGFEYRAMFEPIPLPHDWPVYVSHAEAAAYARWTGKTLPTEAQWHRAAYGAPDGSERFYPWGNSHPQSHHGNFDFGRWDPAPEGAHPAGCSAFGAEGLVGNGWEWTTTVFHPFPGFEPLSFYPGYSANFFDDTHYVMKGGSARTAACLLRRSFRNWFQPRYQFVYVGFRCVDAV